MSTQYRYTDEEIGQLNAEVERLRDRNNMLEVQNDVLRKTLQDYTAALEQKP